MSLFSKFNRHYLRSDSPFHDVGFHGDESLLALVKTLMSSVRTFVETGTNVGSTLAYVARTYPHVHCLSCEPSKHAFRKARKNIGSLSNVLLYNEASQEFMTRLKQEYAYFFDKKETMFWLDSHGYGFKWPIKEEISFITRNFEAAYVLIDDFKVPGLDCFGYDEYDGQECSFEYIKDSLAPNLEYSLYYPCYTEHTSEFHPLRGWGLIEFGYDYQLHLPQTLAEKVRRVNTVDS